jgi:hypothetical protein
VPIYPKRADLTLRWIFGRLIAQTITKPNAARTRPGHRRKAAVATGLAPDGAIFFHQVDDPYSHLAVQMLPALLARYDVDVRPYLVPPPSPAAAPEAARLASYARKDASLVASMHGLAFEAACVPTAPGIGAVAGHLALETPKRNVGYMGGGPRIPVSRLAPPPQPSPA